MHIISWFSLSVYVCVCVSVSARRVGSLRFMPLCERARRKGKKSGETGTWEMETGEGGTREDLKFGGILGLDL
jgi:hypothetical protein